MRVLRKEFRFCFVEAPYVIEPTPDIARVFKGMGPCKAWLLWRAPDQEKAHGEALALVKNAIYHAMDEDDRQGADGEWVGVMGFSQGAKVAASILATNQFRYEEGLGGTPAWPQFRFGVLLAGRGPLVWMDEDEEEMPAGLVTTAALSTVEHTGVPEIPIERRLHTPTLHVHGLQDPGIALHRKMFKRHCHPDHARQLEWQGNHTVAIKTDDITPLVQRILTLATTTTEDIVEGRCS